MQTLPLWPVLMYDFQWAEHDRYRSDLLKVCYEQQAANRTSGVAPDAKRGLYESGFDFITIPDPAVEVFSHWVKNCFFQAAAAANARYWPKGMNVSVEIHESWCHITQDGGYHDMHVHPNSSWSAIYYLETGDTDVSTKNGVNRFYNPNNSMYLDAGTAWVTANTSIDMAAEAGMMVVFPSWVPHSAVQYRGDRDRVVIAANCRIERADMTKVALAI